MNPELLQEFGLNSLYIILLAYTLHGPSSLPAQLQSGLRSQHHRDVATVAAGVTFPPLAGSPQNVVVLYQHMTFLFDCGFRVLLLA